MVIKIQCPHEDCNVRPTGKHRLLTHIWGAHLKNLSKEDIIQHIENYKIDDEVKQSLRSRLLNNEPEISEKDEMLIFDRDCKVDDTKCINNYLHISHPFCREERQYALMLAHLLLKRNIEILEKMGLKGDVLYVFFEVTLMRDYWLVNKKEFNKLLCEYVEGEITLGEEKHANYWEKRNPLAAWMMNAKPDIGLLLREGTDVKLFFVECKYKSKEDDYKDSESNFRLTQTQLQNKILDFLCGTYQIKYCENSTGNHLDCNKKEHKQISKGKVILVQFVSEEKNDQIDATKRIPIKYLIKEYNR